MKVSKENIRINLPDLLHTAEQISRLQKQKMREPDPPPTNHSSQQQRGIRQIQRARSISFAVIIATMGQAHSSPLVAAKQTVSSAMSSRPSSSSTTQVTTDRESVDDLESKIVKAKTNIRGLLDELPSMRKELDACYVVEMIDDAIRSADATLDLVRSQLQMKCQDDPIAQTGTYKLRFHIKCIEQSIEKIRQIRKECALEQKQITTTSACTASSACCAGGAPAIVTPTPEPVTPNSGNAPAFINNTTGSCAPIPEIRHVLAGTFTISDNGARSPASTSANAASVETATANKSKQKKTAGRTATRSSPRRKAIIETKQIGNSRQKVSTVKTTAQASVQSTDVSPPGRRTSSRKHVPTSFFESPEIPKANQKKNNNKSSRITMPLRMVTTGEIDGFVMEDEVLYPVKIKSRDGRMVTVAWRGGYSGTLKVRKGQIVPANAKTIAEWNKLVAEANGIREKLIKDRETKEARKRKKRQEELEIKRAKKARKEKMMELQKERKIREDRAKMFKKYGPPLDANLTSVPKAREEGDVKMEGSRMIYYAHEDDTPECIAKRFSVPVARLIYDNESHVHNIAEKSALKAYTPIILPQEI